MQLTFVVNMKVSDVTTDSSVVMTNILLYTTAGYVKTTGAAATGA